MHKCSGRVIFVGARHHGLIAAGYLAPVGREVPVLERIHRPGRGSWTESGLPHLPAYRLDLPAVAHTILTMTDVPEELDLAGAGLEYLEIDRFSLLPSAGMAGACASTTQSTLR